MLAVFFLALALSMDALALALANALSLRPFRPVYALWMALYFGAFQALMHLLGALLAGTVSACLEALGPFLSFFLLSYVGGRMLCDALDGAETPGMARLSHRRLLLLALASSLDALAVGVTFAFRPELALLRACALIGLVTFAVCLLAALLAGRLAALPGKRAGVLGGGVLLAMGLRLLLEGLAGT